jgi:pimeloyl-ACP methyl ester carboxylesterase
MKKRTIVTLFFILIIASTLYSQSVKKIVLDEKDSVSGYYLAVEPQGNLITGVLVLLPGFGMNAESIFPESKLYNVAYINNILTITFAEGNKLYADSIVQSKLNAVLEDVIRKYKVSPEKFVLSGYSAGGIVALRYVELCNEFPDKYPIKPKGIFTVDSPPDIFTIWDNLEESYKNKYSLMAYNEAVNVMKYVKNDHGVPRENIALYSKLTPFSMDKKYGDNEKYLKNTPVRVYHDVDIAWRLINSTQSVRDDNYYITSELIKRLLIMGNKKAEFMQSFQTGYRSDGRRHPHSWSIVNEVECIQWIKGLLK